jgi:FKBP-type peptidyl-prolyl cis-trans isomerase (trigger factor)
MVEEQKPYTEVTITDLGGSEREIRGEIPLFLVRKLKNEALRHIGDSVVIDGFRKGHVPEDILRKQVGDMTILEEIAERGLKKAYPAILKDFNIPAIGRPSISVTKLAWDNPVGFTITTAVIPSIELPDYKLKAENVISKLEPTDNSVSEKELDQALITIRRNIAHQELHQQQNISPDDHSHPKIEDADLPPLTAEYVKKLGNFENVDDFKSKVKENLKRDKGYKESEKKRLAIIDELIATSTINLPNILTESELDRMHAEFEGQMTRMGIKIDEYYTHIKKTPEEMRTEWRPDAEKRAKLELILAEIAKRENIMPPQDKIDLETAHILEHHKDADKENVRLHVASMITRELVFKFLEEATEDKGEKHSVDR